MKIGSYQRKVRDILARSLISGARRLASDKGWAQGLADLGAPNMLAGLLNLADRGVSPRRVIDAGACQGDWTLLLRSVFPQAKVLMIEPQTRHAETLSALCQTLASDVSFAPALVGPHAAASVEFVVMDDASGGTGSSVLPENSDVPRHVVRMPMTTLDDLIDATGFGLPDFIKLDVQGFERTCSRGTPCN